MSESTAITDLFPPWKWLKNWMQAFLCCFTGESIEEETLENREDRISALPDCLIIQILSLLPSTKDAITTGTLSKRWKSLWTFSPALIFIQEERYGQDHHFPYDFVLFVNRTLTQCCHSKLNKFEFVFEYDIEFEPQVNDWVRYAISYNVEKLNLKLCNYHSGDECVLDKHFFINSGFRDLKLKSCIFNPNGAISWKTLRSLCITNANIDEDLIKNILSGSPVLDTLELHDCYGYRQLDITSVSVKNLVLCGYGDPRDDFIFNVAYVIEINAPNILSLKIQSDLVLWKLLLLDVSSLVEAELDYTKFGYSETTRREAKKEVLKGLIQSLHHVKGLKVGMSCAMVLARLEAKGFPFPSNTKFPNVTKPWCSNSD